MRFYFYISPGAPPAPVRLSGQNFFEEKFSPFQWTGRWKLATNGGSSRHFYRRLNASKTARESKVERIPRLIAWRKSGKMVFFVKRARCNPRLSHFGCPLCFPCLGVKPKKQGGLDSWENLVAACQPCNRKKGNRTPDEAKMPLNKIPRKPNKIHYFQQFISDNQGAWKPYLFMEAF